MARRQLHLISLAILLLITYLLPTSAFATDIQNKKPLKPTELLLELQKNPLLVENLQNPSFSWIVNDEDRGEKQTAYQIVIAKDKDFLTKNGDLKSGVETVWNSGKVISSKSSGVTYKGGQLEKAEHYYWSVRTWDKSDQVSPFAETQKFSTALKDTWAASPIWVGSNHWENYILEFDLKIIDGTAGVFFRSDKSSGYKWQFRASNAVTEPNSLKKFIKSDAGNETPLGNTVNMPESVSLSPSTYVHMKIDISGDTVTTYVDGNKVDQTIDSSFKSGTIGIWQETPTERFAIDNLSVKFDENTLYENSFEGSNSNPFGDGGGYIPTISVVEGELNVGINKDSYPPEYLQYAKPANSIIETGTNWAFLRKSFAVKDKPIKAAIVYATGQSPLQSRQYVYRMNLNGKFVGLGPVRGFNNHNYYNAFDVTSLIVQGKENVIGTTAFTYGDTKSFMAELRIIYKDGTKENVKTDNTWKVLDGSKAFPNEGDVHPASASWVGFKYPNENIQSAQYPGGFDGQGFDDSNWTSAAVTKEIKNLEGYPAPNLTEVDVPPIKVTEKGENSFLIDYGVTVVGGFRLSIDAGEKPEEPVDIKMGEVLDNDGHVKWQSTALVNYNDKWTLKPGKQNLQHFGYRVFRYAEISGLPSFVNAENLSQYLNAFALRYPFNENASKFESSNLMLDKIWSFSKKSIEVLNHDVYIDSPNRERAPYEADAYIQQASHYQLDRDYSLARFSTDWLTHNPTWPMEWKIYSILGSYQDYLNTGDDHLLRKNLNMLQTKVPSKLTNGFDPSTGLVSADPGGGTGENNDIVDWPAGLRDGYEYSKTHNVTNAFYFKAMTDLSKIHSALGQTEKAASYQSNADKSREAIQNNFFDYSANKFKDNIGGKLHYSSQSNSFLVAFGAATPTQAKAAANFLASRGELKGSVYSAPAALMTMLENGQEEEAINFITGMNRDGTTRSSINNWRHMMEVGSGSTMEAWDESNDFTISHSHAWGTAPSIVVPQGIFGIKPIKPAYEEFEIKPIKKGLERASIAVPTIRGTIEAAFHNSDSRYSFNVTVPANTKARVYLPVSNQHVFENGIPADKAKGVKFIEIRDESVVYEIQSGRYMFSTEMPNNDIPNNGKVEIKKDGGMVYNSIGKFGKIVDVKVDNQDKIEAYIDSKTGLLVVLGNGIEGRAKITLIMNDNGKKKTQPLHVELN